MLKKYVLLAVSIFWTLVIIILSLIVIEDTISYIQVPNKDKIVHFLFYFVFVSLWYSYFRETNNKVNLGWYVFFTAALLGIVIELCQMFFTTTRHADSKDVLANTVGALLGLLFISVTNKIISKK